MVCHVVITGIEVCITWIAIRAWIIWNARYLIIVCHLAAASLWQHVLPSIGTSVCVWMFATILIVYDLHIFIGNLKRIELICCISIRPYFQRGHGRMGSKMVQTMDFWQHIYHHWRWGFNVHFVTTFLIFLHQ